MEEEIEEKVRCIKKEEGKIQIGKVSKTKIQISTFTQRRNQQVNRRHKLPTYLRPRSPHGALILINFGVLPTDAINNQM